MEKKNTHFILKEEDIEKYLTDKQQLQLRLIATAIAEGRSKDNKKPVNEYYICNVDELYSHKVLEAIQEGETMFAHP